MPVLGTDPGTYQSEPLVDWDLVSSPQEGAAGRAIHYARGKTLGGSSALNTMAYVRGSKGTHDLWAEEVGDDSYRWDSVLPFFKASAQLTPPDLEKRNAPNATPTWDPDAFSGNDGTGAQQRPLRVSFGNWVDPTTSWLARGLQGIGMAPAPKGLNSGSISGVGGWTSSTIDPRDATRSSSQTSYLKLAEQETGIKVYSHTQASRIIFDAEKAIGVAVESQGTAFTLNARKEIILSGGVFHSPQLLMVSGKWNKAKLYYLFRVA